MPAMEINAQSHGWGRLTDRRMGATPVVPRLRELGREGESGNQERRDGPQSTDSTQSNADREGQRRSADRRQRTHLG